MKKFIAVIDRTETTGERPCIELYESHNKYFNDTFSPATPTLEIMGLDLSLRGLSFLTVKPGKITDYQKRKSVLEEKAHEWQRISAEYPTDWGTFSTVSNWFHDQGRKYGLLEEFEINGIC